MQGTEAFKSFFDYCCNFGLTNLISYNYKEDSFMKLPPAAFCLQKRLKQSLLTYYCRQLQ